MSFLVDKIIKRKPTHLIQKDGLPAKKEQLGVK
ncbi:hypothetical protein AS54_5523 (plasmid) [Bacillus cereus 03BB102]|nr:hypothetical protein AS54_5523 [Bacillus cereus 03BB102]